MNIEVQYIDLIEKVLLDGHTKNDRTGTGTISTYGHQLRHDMRNGFPLLTVKKMYWKGIIAELLWFLRGDTNIKYLIDNDCHIWNGDAYRDYKNTNPGSLRSEELVRLERAGGAVYRPYTIEEFADRIKMYGDFSRKWGDMGPIYGKQWRRASHPEHSDIDQVQYIVDLLRSDPDSRRMVVSSWSVHEIDQMVLPPCHYSFQLYTRELSPPEIEMYNKKRAVSLMWNQRSADLFLGLPFNIASYALLLEIFARAANMVAEELICSIGDAHVYSNHHMQCVEMINRTPYIMPQIEINTNGADWSTMSVDEIVKNIDIRNTFTLHNYQSHPAIKAPLSN